VTAIVQQVAFWAVVVLAVYLLWSAAAVIALAMRWPDRVDSMRLLALVGAAFAALAVVVLLAPVGLA